MPPPNSLRLVLSITLSAMLLGALFGGVEYQSVGGADVANTYLHGALVGGLIGGVLSSIEIFVLRGDAGAPFRQIAVSSSISAFARFSTSASSCSSKRP